jgi:hypothetical protein
MSKIVIIHPDMYNSEKDTVLLESFTSYVVPIKYDDEMTKEDLFIEINKISNTNNVKQIAFIYHNPGHCKLPFFYDNIKETPKYIYWTNTVIDIIRELKGVRSENLKSDEFIVDILSCDLNNSLYKEEVQKIEDGLEINIRYSIDKTGNNENSGNWILESDNINIKDDYFTDKILEWNGILANTNLAPAIKAGTYSNFITWNSSNKTYTIVKDFLWTELGVSNTDYINLDNGETFDGNGKTINLVGITNWTGLFFSSATDSSTIPLIKNLGVLNGRLNSNESGFICRGYCRFIKINNCYTTGNITRNSCGGIIGLFAGINGYCEINNCYTTGNMTANSILLFCDSSGGITGAGAGSNGRCIINNCYSTGNLTERAINCGGIIGSTPARDNGYCEINNCYTTGNIIGISSGGIVGFITLNSSQTIINISNCYSLGINNEYSGGILGELGVILPDTIYVNNCVYNGGNISATESNLINTSNCTNNLSVLNNSIYNWNSSIWTIGGDVPVTINGVPAIIYKLPILKNFQIIPWLFNSSDPEYYNQVTDPAQFYQEPPTPPTPPTPNSSDTILVPPCCNVNICTKNPQMTSYDNTTITNNNSGLSIANNVTQIQNTGIYRRNGAQPIFKTYQQYMMYLQSKHH